MCGKTLGKLWNDRNGSFGFRGFRVSDCVAPYGWSDFEPSKGFLVFGGLIRFPREATQFSQAKPREGSRGHGCCRWLRKNLQDRRDFPKGVRFRLSRKSGYLHGSTNL